MSVYAVRERLPRSESPLRQRRRLVHKIQPASEHPHGLSDLEFDSLFTTDKPVMFNFHGYPWLIHKRAYRFNNHESLHVRGYKERENINTPINSRSSET